MNSCYASNCGPCGPRQFLTREEKVAKLQSYKDALDLESKGVAERIQELRSSEEDEE